ncbi:MULTISPECIES: S8 family serine peptidase [unclassified Sutcliffiella]|uniref:S8 family serine peptidase n=1 Tax=unclassified Sutcliffiella TaxID=2837532 RepID=UPI0030D33CF2
MKRKNILGLMLVGALLISSITPAISNPNTVVAEGDIGIKDAMTSLSAEKRRAINDLTASVTSEVNLPGDIDYSSDEEISIIVEFNHFTPKTAVAIREAEGETASIEEQQQLVEKDHQIFAKELLELNIDGEVTQSYKEAFNGVTVNLPASDIPKLIKSKAIKNIWENETIQLELPENKEKMVQQAYDGKHPLELTGVNKLHEKGLTGKGIKVAVLDTGIDYHHPDLQDVYRGGYDFVDEDDDPMEATYSDWLESGLPESLGSNAYYTSHGTHVAGIIAGQNENDSPLSVLGVAPGVELYAYRVLGPYGTGTMEDILAGIEYSVRAEMDIINLSLGNNINDPLSPFSVALNNAVLAGVTTISAAGNTGSALYSIGSPAASALNITVGSTDTMVAYPDFEGEFLYEEGKESSEVRYATAGMENSPRSLEGKAFEVIDAGNGLQSDYENIDVNGKIVLIKTGSIRTDEKIAIAKEHGAAVVFSYTPGYGNYNGVVYRENENFVPTYHLRGVQGDKIKQILAIDDMTFTFTKLVPTVVVQDDTLSSFSSRGPARLTYDIKPEIVAPGGNILSTVPHYYGGKEKNYSSAYAKLSGTSMATPYVAGIAALLLEANPSLTPGDIKALLMNSAEPINGSNSVFDIGAGRVNAWKAETASVTIKVMDKTETFIDGEKKWVPSVTGALALGTLITNDSHHRENASITLTNHLDKKVTFTIDSQFHVGIRGSKDGAKNGVKVNTKKSVSIAAKKQATNNIFLTIPKTAEEGVYEGTITFTNVEDESNSYQVPFAFRLSKDGIEYLTANDTLSTIRENYSGGPNAMNAKFSLYSHMRDIDVYLTDANTGDELGFVGSIDGTFLQVEKPYSFYTFSNGEYYAFTNDPNSPITYETIEATPGSYYLKFVFTKDDGEELLVNMPFIIDKEMPTLEMDVETEIIEVEQEKTTYLLEGSIHDNQIESAKTTGIDVNQGNNSVRYKGSGSFWQNIPLDDDGGFAINASFPRHLNVMNLSILGRDRAGIASIQKDYHFVRKGAPYVASIPTQKEILSGDSMEFAFRTNNLAPWKELSFSYQYNKNVIDIKEISVVEDWKEKVHLETTESDNGTLITLTTTESNLEDVTTLLNVNVTIKDDAFVSDYFSLTANSVSLTKADNSKVSVSSISPPVKVWSSYSELQGNINGEAVYERDGFGNLRSTHIDYFALGANIRVLDAEGNEYPAEIKDDAKFSVLGLPSTQEKMFLLLDIPGHFTVIKSFTIGREHSHLGEQKFLNFLGALAGDVNKDGVIDILDAIYLEEHWGSNDRNADINFDGVVDHKDMSFIQKNYLLKNPTGEASREPTEVENGRTIDDILEGLN